MRKADPVQCRWRNAVFFLVALLVVAADQLSKLWIRAYPEGQLVFQAGFLRIGHISPNSGAAFGIFAGHSFALMIVGFVGSIIILVYALFVCRRFPFLGSMLDKVTLGLILGGTVGNLIDRIRLGGVTDFIWVGSWWPAFNIADSAIVVGVIIFACSLLRLAQAEKKQDEQGI